jgi:uncharacterized protein YxeA
MKSSQAKKAVEKIAELTGAEISEDNLFLESIVMSNARLRLAISKVGDCVEMNRIPASYFWGHFTMLCSVIGICIFGFLEAQQSSTVENVKAIIWSVIIITSGYGFIAWVNRKAERENPVVRPEEEAAGCRAATAADQAGRHPVHHRAGERASPSEQATDSQRAEAHLQIRHRNRFRLRGDRQKLQASPAGLRRRDHTLRPRIEDPLPARKSEHRW